jgi:hypothetical protein
MEVWLVRILLKSWKRDGWLEALAFGVVAKDAKNSLAEKILIASVESEMLSSHWQDKTKTERNVCILGALCRENKGETT